MNNNKQKTVIHPVWGETQIDEEIAELIESLWKLEIITHDCSQENIPGVVWIEFASGEDAERFLNVLFFLLNDNKKELINLYERVFLKPDDSWKFVFTYSNHKEDQKNYNTPNNILFSIILRFPASDYQVVLKGITDFMIMHQSNNGNFRLGKFLNQLD